MKESNNIGIDSVEEKVNKKKERPYYRDQQKFYELHPRQYTNEGKILSYLFGRRTAIEEEKSKLEKEMKNLEHQFDDLSQYLHRMKKGPPISYFLIYGGMGDSIRETEKDLNYVQIEFKRIKKNIQNKEKEIDELNISINKQIQEIYGDEIIPVQVPKQSSRKAETTEHIKSLFEQANNRRKN